LRKEGGRRRERKRKKEKERKKERKKKKKKRREKQSDVVALEAQLLLRIKKIRNNKQNKNL